MHTNNTTARKKQRLKGIQSAARAFGVTAHHLRLVVNGERRSPGLLAKWFAFQRESEKFQARILQLAK